MQVPLLVGIPANTKRDRTNQKINLQSVQQQRLKNNYRSK